MEAERIPFFSCPAGEERGSLFENLAYSLPCIIFWDFETLFSYFNIKINSKNASFKYPDVPKTVKNVFIDMEINIKSTFELRPGCLRR